MSCNYKWKYRIAQLCYSLINNRARERFIFGLFYISILLLVSCKKKENFVINNLNGGRITIIGHAGSGLSSLDNPVKEDTYTSIINALELYGAEGVEMDVHLSKDSVFY